MKIRMPWKRIGATLLAVVMGIGCISAAAFARESIETDRATSLSIYFGADGIGFSAVNFSIYRVANTSENGAFTLTGDFADYSVNLEDLDSSGWRALAQTLAVYTARDELKPLRTQRTGQGGRVSFAGLAVGLYLVIGEEYADANAIYTPEPMLVSLPEWTEEGDWNYGIEATCKFDRRDKTPGRVSRKVQKVWKDDGNEDTRPKEISVQLLENGTVVDTVLLNKKNNWEYTWENLDSNARWQVVESEVPAGYTVTVAQEGTIFVITNTRPYEPPPKLPQTGMLWWPVPVLACGGLLLVLAGWMVRRKQGDSHGK